MAALWSQLVTGDDAPGDPPHGSTKPGRSVGEGWAPWHEPQHGVPGSEIDEMVETTWGVAQLEIFTMIKLMVKQLPELSPHKPVG